jgi:hypothetical protein
VAIAAIAVFTGNHPPIVESKFEYNFLETELQYRYKTYHILQHTPDELLAMNNPFAFESFIFFYNFNRI